MNYLANVKLRPGSMDQAVLGEMVRDVYHVRKLIRAGDTVLDIGGYTGLFALSIKDVCPGAKIVSVEPEPENYATLQENIRGTDVSAVNMALVSEPGVVTLKNYGLEASACHSIFDLTPGEGELISVDGITLSQLFERYAIQTVRVLKLDCQGAEFDILSTASRELLAKIDFISMEVHWAIADARRILGRIPDFEKKRERMYRNLYSTHLPVLGSIRQESIQLWASRRLLPLWRTASGDVQRVLRSSVRWARRFVHRSEVAVSQVADRKSAI
jgi:FkbM family methyltransferase